MLNCMGLTMLVLSPLALLALAQRAGWAVVTGIIFAGLSPVISSVNWAFFRRR